jgi:hypothetical protein
MDTILFAERNRAAAENPCCPALGDCGRDNLLVDIYPPRHARPLRYPVWPAFARHTSSAICLRRPSSAKTGFRGATLDPSSQRTAHRTAGTPAQTTASVRALEQRRPPRIPCPRCRAETWEWKASSGRGKLYTWTVTHWFQTAKTDDPAHLARGTLRDRNRKSGGKVVAESDIRTSQSVVNA